MSKTISYQKQNVKHVFKLFQFWFGNLDGGRKILNVLILKAFSFQYT